MSIPINLLVLTDNSLSEMQTSTDLQGMQTTTSQCTTATAAQGRNLQKHLHIPALASQEVLGLEVLVGDVFHTAA